MGKKGSYKRQIKRIICDAGPIIHLYEGHLLYLLQNIGEAEALLLAWKQKADWFVTDDSTARLFSSLLDIEAHGSLGILLWNVAKGYLLSEEAEDALNRLRNSSLWLSEKVFEEARKALIDMIS